MKKLLIAFCSLSLIACCSKNGAESGKDTTPSGYNVETPSFAKGADVSWLSEMEAGGKTFKKKDGTTADCFDVLKDCGVNSIRLRVWVDPYKGWSGKEDMVKLAERAAKAGMALMVDFHYSDFFCDPLRQGIPKAWQADATDVNKMCVHVKEHTTEVLQALKDKGISPAWIQIGNETPNGFLWPIGKLWATGSETVGGKDNFNALYRAGYNAAKAVFPNALVGPHLNNAYDSKTDWWFKDRKDAGCKFDMICLSHYPQTHKDPATCNSSAINRIKSLSSTYGVPVIISEVGVKIATGSSPYGGETAAAAVLTEFMTEVKKLPATTCAGVFYWEPEVYDWWKPAVYGDANAMYQYTGKKETWNNAYDMGAFLAGGKPSKIMDALCK
ncbi:MAG: glycosyl hydrolase 53 family protein [Bacteroidales bacterium]|nr:glycosyl hydrolase 53 family protein [Bacteroidales bacterium]